MLQIFEDFKARVSPCNYCDVMGREIVYPDCCFMCPDVSKYLISIQDIPYKPYNGEKDLSKVYPPKGVTGLKPADFCTEKQYIELSEKLTKSKRSIIPISSPF